VFVAAMARLPAAWVLTGLVVALFGLAPRLVLGAWAVLAGFLLLGEFGTLLRLDPRLIDLSPFTHVPKLPGGELTMTPLMWLTLVALVLTATGLAGFRRRDIG
jgi:ABC-2 type transport system permease protein